ncbi:hypothetical protein IRJ41_017605 [Triplophysa rosa]|uniref:Uncharacterized protein n=1 Tax=Triplophysa rosa TaxID=992332 RepID=A0A9W7TMI5_TRIRA|nr:hypothetical protein IRJ41_017605 [Triplophysa rosa]
MTRGMLQRTEKPKLHADTSKLPATRTAWSSVLPLVVAAVIQQYRTFRKTIAPVWREAMFHWQLMSSSKLRELGIGGKRTGAE